MRVDSNPSRSHTCTLHQSIRLIHILSFTIWIWSYFLGWQNNLWITDHRRTDRHRILNSILDYLLVHGGFSWGFLRYWDFCRHVGNFFSMLLTQFPLLGPGFWALCWNHNFCCVSTIFNDFDLSLDSSSELETQKRSGSELESIPALSWNQGLTQGSWRTLSTRPRTRTSVQP